ncbi:uncharacterized protein LOC106668139 isoform X1 [Cimex lectularius]|uniref:Matrin-type domain-containing protein n=1 Tax=Cimex lectularius TaxID=79782 RepID=A0A8I6RVF6_CIMLE|nr:uncharacterized protein LOC106668139 isoform X1 [Cimex lectularius]
MKRSVKPVSSVGNRENYFKEHHNPEFRKEDIHRNKYHEIVSPRKDYQEIMYKYVYSEHKRQTRSHDKYFYSKVPHSIKDYQKYDNREYMQRKMKQDYSVKKRSYQLPGQWEYMNYGYGDPRTYEEYAQKRYYLKKRMYQKENGHYYSYHSQHRELEHKPKMRRARESDDEGEEEEGEIKEELEKDLEIKELYRLKGELSEEILNEKQENDHTASLVKSNENNIHNNYDHSKDQLQKEKDNHFYYNNEFTGQYQIPEEKDELEVLDSEFMILDAVGSGDDSVSESSVEDIEEILDSEDERKIDEDHLGAEYCQLVYYCRLCKKYLQGDSVKEKALQIHCRSRFHIQNFQRVKSAKPERRALSQIQEVSH